MGSSPGGNRARRYAAGMDEHDAATTTDGPASESGRLGPVATPPVDLSELEGRLAAIEAALARIEAGESDRCAACGATIDSARLEAEPLTDRCGRCSASSQGPGEPVHGGG